MKRKIITRIAIFLFLIVGIWLVWINYPVLESGKYYTRDERSSVIINTDGTFRYHIHSFRSLAPEGTYKVTRNVLTLKSSLGDYEFLIKNKKLVFKSGNDLTDEEIEKGETYKLKKK